ncbi:MAG: hypothetical protein J5829_05375 [Lachnospiraceae bacterium]|nr:hypothetical protein [Lachnospiraceae bacterium]
MSSFDTWLEFFIIDHNISVADVVYEGIVDGQMKHCTYREFFEAIKPYPMIQERVRNDLAVAAATGESIRAAASRICEEELISKGHPV